MRITITNYKNMAFNLFDFSSKLNPLGNVVPTTPKASPQIGGATGGGIMPPTTSARPLPQTPIVKKPSFMEKAVNMVVPKASASMSEKDMQDLIDAGASDEEILQVAQEMEKQKPVVQPTQETTSKMEKPTSSESVFKDQYADEGIFKQGLKALPRALGNVAEMTAESIGTL